MFKKISLIVIAVFVLYSAQRVFRHFNRPNVLPLPAREEVALKIIPGWNLRQIADYLVLEGFASSTKEVFYTTGEPARDYRQTKLQPPELIDENGFAAFPDRVERNNLSYEGYIAPQTIRVFKDAKLSEVIIKFLNQRHQEIKDIVEATEGGSIHSWQEILTMASLVEDEARTEDDRRLVADILWRRVAKNWALQLDSTVHYAIDKMGDVYTTGKERDVASPWNTYKYPGLPPGPICNPSIESIKAALNPEPNTYWYFLSGRDGKMHYAKTLEEHNANKKYL